jgi:hypothetical protein
VIEAVGAYENGAGCPVHPYIFARRSKIVLALIKLILKRSGKF